MSAGVRVNVRCNAALKPEVAPPERQRFSKRERATQRVLNWAILFLVIPIPLALTHAPARYGMAAMLVATMWLHSSTGAMLASE